MFKPLGTILPTAKSEAITETSYARIQKEKKSVEKKLTGKKKVVLGENRYYDTPNTYCIVGKDLKVRRFEVRQDGEYFLHFVS